MTELLKTFAPISLEQMSSVKLMNRTDTKFVTTQQRLQQLLTMALKDSRDFDMYSEHQHGHANRQKIRFRTYCISGLKFMEVKTKNNHGRTKKKRMEVSDMDVHEAVKRNFLSQYLNYSVDTLQPVLNNHFSRITLVNKAKTERLTIDSRLSFRNLVNGTQKDMGNLVIIELKRDGRVSSPILEMLRQLHIHPHGFSKYCMGSALTNPQLPCNRFKRKLIEINKIVNNA